VNATFGIETQEDFYRQLQAQNVNVPFTENLRYFSAAVDASTGTIGSNQGSSSYFSVFERLNYTYKGRYLFTGTLRYDGSSSFERSYRWGAFPSFAVGWNVSEESFLQNADWLSNLKLRAGWGLVGNAASAGNTELTYTTGQNYVFGSTLAPGTASQSLANPTLQWETLESTNFGIDASFLNGKISLQADYFIKLTKDMILANPIPDFVGAGAPTVNAGSMENKGFEIALNYRNSPTNAFTFDIGANASFIQNEITDLGEGGIEEPSANVSRLNETKYIGVGEEFGYFYGLTTDGIFNTQEELDAHAVGGVPIQPAAELGDVKFIDLNGNGEIDDDDKTKIGSPYPGIVYGFNANFTYKGFDLRAFFQGVYDVDILNVQLERSANPRGITNSYAFRLDSWTPENPTSNEPRMTAIDPNNNGQYSDRYIEDGSYLRLKNIQLGYNFPDSFVENMGIQALRIYVASDNLFTWTDYRGFDPEVSDNVPNVGNSPLFLGIDVGTYPSATTFFGGINLKF